MYVSVVYLLFAASFAVKIQVIRYFLTMRRFLSLSHLGAQNSIPDPTVASPSCTSLNKMCFTIHLGLYLTQICQQPFYRGALCVETRRKRRGLRQLREARAIKGCCCRHRTKAFPRHWNDWLILIIDLQFLAATQSGDIVKEKVLGFLEHSVLQTTLVYYR